MAYIDYPYAVSFLNLKLPLLPLDEESLSPEKNAWAVRLSLQWINVWSYQLSRFIVDGEEAQLTPTLRLALSRRDQIGLSLPLKVAGGGVLDPYVEGFHRMVGAEQSKRDLYQANRLNIRYEPLGAFYWALDNDPLLTLLRAYDVRQNPRAKDGGRIWDILGFARPAYLEVVPFQEKEISGPGNARFFYQRVFFRRSGGFIEQVKGGVQFKLPTSGHRYLGSPGVDSSVFITVGQKKKTRGVAWRLGASYTILSPEQYLFFTLPGRLWTVRPAADFFWGSKWEASLEYVYFSATVKNLGRLSKPGHQLALAFRRQEDDQKLTVAIIEDFANFSVTPDIGFHFSFEVKR